MDSSDISSSFKAEINTLPSQNNIIGSQTLVSKNIDELYQNINQLIHSVEDKNDQIKFDRIQQNPMINMTFDQDPSQLKLKIRTLEIEVGVQKDIIVRLEGQKIRLQGDLQDLKAQMGINHNNISLNKSCDSTNNEQMLILEIQKLRNEIQRLSNSEQKTLKQIEYETAIKNLTVEVQRLMAINDQKNNIQYTNQMLRGELNKVIEINRVVSHQIGMYKQAINNYSQQRIQLYQHLEIAKEMQSRILMLQASNEKLQNELSKQKIIQQKTQRKNQNVKSIQRQFIKSRVVNSHKSNTSPLDDLPNGSRFKPQTPKHIKQNVSVSKVMSPTNKTSKITMQNSSKITGEHSKWMKLQERINALKSQNEELKKSIYTK